MIVGFKRVGSFPAEDLQCAREGSLAAGIGLRVKRRRFVLEEQEEESLAALGRGVEERDELFE